MSHLLYCSFSFIRIRNKPNKKSSNVNEPCMNLVTNIFAALLFARIWNLNWFEKKPQNRFSSFFIAREWKTEPVPIAYISEEKKSYMSRMYAVWMKIAFLLFKTRPSQMTVSYFHIEIFLICLWHSDEESFMTFSCLCHLNGPNAIACSRSG